MPDAASDATNGRESGFTRERLSRLLSDFAPDLIRESGVSDPVDALFELLKDPARHQESAGLTLAAAFTGLPNSVSGQAS